MLCVDRGWVKVEFVQVESFAFESPSSFGRDWIVIEECGLWTIEGPSLGFDYDRNFATADEAMEACKRYEKQAEAEYDRNAQRSFLDECSRERN